jgi:sulfite reductase (NADPH) flavoprotein alpha-component|tara:strand:- start:4550 stop:6742 length:2193 start_codon:yes stop_codon:yes gene_type:complete
MVVSIWRFSHFLLALISTSFLMLISVSGALLALEPIGVTAQPYNTIDLDEVFISETITSLKKKYDEILELEITPEEFVKASVFTKKGIYKTIYIDPIKGSKLADVKTQSEFFSLITNFHRSLFFKSIGRAFVGIVSILLCFISVTGIFLLAQRQGGFNKLFSKVQESNFGQRYHVIFGRWFLLPILIIASTGVYLSAEKFSLIPKSIINHNLTNLESQYLTNNIQSIGLFEKTRLSEVRKLTFPFSKNTTDYFELALNDKELIIHQYTGAVLSETPYPFTLLASRWSLLIHTGQGSLLWSIILLMTSLSLLFFMYSGLSMSIKRQRKSKKIVSQYSKDEAEYIILVGSETGNTYAFANTFYDALKNKKKTVHLSTLNEYSSYVNASHVIVFTATYGDGDAPSNARNFEILLNKIKPIKPIQFSVVGFGSLFYPHYCRFAIKVDLLLNSHKSFKRVKNLVKINDQSQVAFLDWLQSWNKETGISLNVSLPNEQKKHLKKRIFTVIKCTSLNNDNTAIIRLRPHKKISYQSGDLLHIIPPKNSTARKYSIAKIKDEILLSVKWYPKGICSTYLCTLKAGDKVYGSIEKNSNFHFPKKASSVWLIANGTGIAPYLGMLDENTQTPIRLTWGGRTESSFDHYKEFIDLSISKGYLKDYQLSLSQVAKKRYVQDLLSQQQKEISETLEKGGVFMICGSIAMQHSVLDVLEEIATTQLQVPLSEFENNGQLLMDCY